VPELVWDGKYDKDGKRVAPLRVSLPFQTVETINESVQERQRSLDLFGSGRDGEWRNRLIWGDNKYVLPALLEEFASRIDLVYIDPPFATGQDFSFLSAIPESNETFMKEPSVIEQKAYRDTWGRGLDSYLQMMYERLLLIRELLTNNGSIYVHIGPELAGSVRCLMDEVFGPECRLNELIWKRTPFAGSSKARASKFPVNHDSIFYYAKTPGQYTFRHSYQDYTEEYKARFKYEDERGLYRKTLLKTYSAETERRLKDEGRWIDPVRAGAYPSYKQYLHESKGKQVEDIWDDLNLANPMAGERTGYATQKPEVLIQRIMETSSNPDGLVADFFCGSGTTLAVAEKLGRRWIGCDLGRFAIQLSRKRLLAISGVKPFLVQNLGKYERQLWQAAEFGDKATARTAAYRRFILDLYHARPIEGYSWLHGVKNGRMVHVSTVDAPVTVGDVKQIASEFRKSIGTGKDAPNAKSVDVLGWDFAFELNEVARQEAARAGIEMRFVRIPREVLEKRAVEQADIRFFELAALAVDLKHESRKVSVSLTDFVIPLDDVPDDVQRAITSWTQWIDYWAIDWDNRDDTFHNQWQSYRTRRNNDIDLAASYTYEEPGTYTIVVKVIDILGNDTTKSVSVTIPSHAP
jgi:DNA modification methylase